MTQTRSASSFSPRLLPKRQYYHHSGIVPAMGIAAGLGGGIVCATVGALIYAYADLYMPIIYGNFLLTAGFALFLAYAPLYLMRATKVRNTAVLLATVGVVSLAGYYLCWIFWLYALFQKASHPIDFLRLANHPRALILLIQIINESGTWSFGHIGSNSTPANGMFLWLVWAAEAFTILFVPVWMARRMDASRIFCEKCDRWSGPGRTFAQTVPVPPEDIKKRLEACDLAFIPALPRWDGRPGQYYQWERHQCDSCKELNTLTVSSVTKTVDKKGRTSTKTKKLVDRMILQPGDVEAMTAAPPVTVSSGTAAPKEQT